MTQQSEALRLADALEMSSNHGIRREAAAELRRLYDLADKYKWQVIDTCARAEKAETQRDALLEALRQIVEQHGQWNNGIWAANIARAAIAKAEGRA